MDRDAIKRVSPATDRLDHSQSTSLQDDKATSYHLDLDAIHHSTLTHFHQRLLGVHPLASRPGEETPRTWADVLESPLATTCT